MKGRVLSATSILVLVGLVSFSPASFAQGGDEKKASAKPHERQLFFGEQHLHTRNSPDAFVVGTRGTWGDAYDWALGTWRRAPYAIGSMAAFWTVQRVYESWR